MSSTLLPAPRGLAAVRALRSLAIAGGDLLGAIGFAESQGWRDTPGVVRYLRAAINPIDVGDMPGAVDPVLVDLAAATRPLTILGRLAAARRVPFQTKVAAMASGARGAFVGAGRPVPISRASFGSAIELGPARAQAAIIVSDELLRAGGPGGESVLRADLVNACVEAIDRRFIDPSIAPVFDVAPGSITNGAASAPSSGATVAAIDEDLAGTIDALSTAGSDLAQATWIMHPRSAAYIGRLRGSGGSLAFPGMSALGGVLAGFPCITSSAMPIAADTSATTVIVLVDAAEITYADDGDGSLDISREAVVQADDSPTAIERSLVSLWQENLVGLRAERYINWCLRRPYVQTIVGVPY